ncbi:intercellular adhesion molecule 2-like isoform X2 [Antennarius striatus]
MLWPPVLVVRFGDPFRANCSVQRAGFSLLGWEVSLAAPEPTMDRYLVWSVDRMSEWGIRATCYALSEHGGQCDISLPLLVYKPPEVVSIGVSNHSGVLFEGQPYTLQCSVQDVAPVGNLTVTFYRGQRSLGRLQSNNTESKPVTEVFSLDISPRKEDNGVQYWCEARLELGAEGPHPPLVVKSQNYTATVLFGPQLTCPTKLRVREGERLGCEVTGNPEPSVTWFRDGQAVVLPARPGREHAGTYTVLATGPLEQKNFTVEVEILTGRGAANSQNGQFLLVVLLQVMIWL